MCLRLAEPVACCWMGGGMSEWISVKDRLPKPFEFVVVHPRPSDYNMEGCVDMGGKWSTTEYEREGEISFGITVRYWYEIPKAPE